MSTAIAMFHAVDEKLVRPGRTPAPVEIERPEGIDYVRFEDLYVGRDTLQQTYNRASLNVNGDQVIVTMPEEIFECTGFNEGYMQGFRIGGGPGGAGGCRGIWGSGRNTIFRVKEGTASGSLPGNIAGETIGMHSATNGLFKNFQVQGLPQNGLYYGGIRITESHSAKMDNLYLRGASPGYSNYPPGETFGVNVYQSMDVEILDSEFDGRDLDGAPVCSSSIGWNGSGAATSPSNLSRNAVVKRVYAHHALTGHVTFWQTLNVYTEDLHTFANGTGSGGLAGFGINHEESNGHIMHVRPKLFMHGYGVTAPDATGNRGHHMTMHNTSADMLDVTVLEPEWDRASGSGGVFCVEQYDNYTGVHTGTLNLVTTPPTIIYQGNQLTAKQHPLSGWGDGPRDQYFAIIN